MGGILALPDYRAKVLNAVSQWNDVTQGWLYSPNRLAKTYSLSDVSQNFPFNAFYPEAYSPIVDINN